MFNKVLIANRGEIACRILKACQKLGIRTVAVYSEADAKAIHVQLADEAYLLGPSSPHESYLNQARIIEIAKSTNSDAIHPGYGFLSENPDFADHCESAGIRFVGPSGDIMRIMADKVIAKNLARKAGVPVLPGTDKPVKDSKALSIAKKIGFPIMMKATQGGGGIGMHIIHSPDDLDSIIQKGRILAEDNFGNSDIYFERYLYGASHIEVQIIADMHNNVLHLFARDCSIQRRNQKVIEEGPAFKLSSVQRKRMWGYAINLVKEIGYVNAGTVEFLAYPSGEMYFLEMNTRLQVEHAVTEMISGIDLVELQLRVASGEPLNLKQNNIKVEGHAIEARIYPEDPDTLKPSPGIITTFHQPSGEHIRVDSALFPGYEVTQYYEPLMAKLICWGNSREDARIRMNWALDMFRVEGLVTNIPLIKTIINHPAFISGTHHTAFLEEHMATSNQTETRDAHNNTDIDFRELAAIIGLSILLSDMSPNPGSTAMRWNHRDLWNVYGRKEQMLTRTLRSQTWHTNE